MVTFLDALKQARRLGHHFARLEHDEGIPSYFAECDRCGRWITYDATDGEPPSGGCLRWRCTGRKLG